MRFPLLILMVVVLAGCLHPERKVAAVAKVEPSPTPVAVKSWRTLEMFRFIGPSTTMLQVRGRVGAPDAYVGGGYREGIYRLADGSEVVIGSPDGVHVVYVRHGGEVLFSRL